MVYSNKKYNPSPYCTFVRVCVHRAQTANDTGTHDIIMVFYKIRFC